MKTHESSRGATGVRLTALAIAAVLTLVLPRWSAAQQDTSRHTMHGMPGMPGMKMGTPRPATAQKAQSPKPAKKKVKAKAKPGAKASPKASSKTSLKSSPKSSSKTPAKTSLTTPPKASPTTPPQPAPAAHQHMPGMDMSKPMTDSAPGAHVHPEPSAAHDMKGMTAGDTGMKMSDTSGMKGMTMGAHSGTMAGMRMMTPDPLGVSMDRMGSGTTWVPEAAPIPSLFFSGPGNWDVTGHGFAFLQYDAQSGPRGSRQLGSLNWMMLMASHAVAGGRLQARTMLSLDPVTVTPKGYPLLLQSGEAYDGEPLHDRQHPHDLFMELSVLYEKPVSKRLGVMLYAAPSGEPALGPVAFMHRPSAMDNPAAPITHHWADATHVAFGVLSAGLFTHTFKLEGSLFNGREPDQHRFNIDPVRLDSWSGRASYNPTTEWSFTAGYGYMKSPEALDPTESMRRVTASMLHGSTLGADGQWSSSLVYGGNQHGGHSGLSHSLLVESEAVLDARHTLFGRAEFVQKSAEDLSLDSAPFAFAHDRSFDVGQVSLGYIRDFARLGAGTLGAGAMGTVNVVPSALAAAYGSRTPLGMFVFLRVRPFRIGMSMAGPAHQH